MGQVVLPSANDGFSKGWRIRNLPSQLTGQTQGTSQFLLPSNILTMLLGLAPGSALVMRIRFEKEELCL